MREIKRELRVKKEKMWIYNKIEEYKNKFVNKLEL